MARAMICFVLMSAASCPCTRALAETPISVTLEDIDSGTTSPQGDYRWMDVANQVYDIDVGTDGYSYQDSYDYTQASVQVDFFTDSQALHGTLTAGDLKPHFAYQFKFLGVPDTDANEYIGFTGRWWQQEWNGSDWTNGGNLNNKGDGSWPNPNDITYCTRRDIPDGTSPTGRHYQYTAYLVFDYFITDECGNASLTFEANSSYHVLWKTSQRTPGAQDGPLRTTTFTGGDPDPVNAYDTVYPEATVAIFGEWERLPAGGVTLPAGDYEGQFILTEESFHGGIPWCGGWAAAMGAPVSFTLIADPAALPGDYDRDGDVDIDDYTLFSHCLAGPGVTVTEPICPATAQGCLDAFDFDSDNDVDLKDFTEFQEAFAG